jgi:pimeloyl-ACP methyl ester carboxylesterase
MGNPVIFVHGIGASATVWQKFDIPDREVFYISFSNKYADPRKQVPELAQFIDDVLRKTGQDKVALVCHSMGGLVARKYLADPANSEKVEKLILLSTPNRGTAGLCFNWCPIVMILAGLIGYRYAWPVFFTVAGIVWELFSYTRGVLLLSPAAWAMRPRSAFLRELNAQPMPREVKYVSILSNATDYPHRLVNLFFFREGGDGAVPLSSQKLCAPNMAELNYTELKIDLPHFKIPRRADAAILQALAC